MWLATAALVLLGLLLAFVLATDGRYIGRGLMHFAYDRVGAAAFGSRSEGDRWRAWASWIPLRGGEAVLDVGTAVGDLPLTIAALPNFHGRVVGIDRSPRMIAAATAEAGRRRLGHRAAFLVADASEPLPFDDAEFDVVSRLRLLEAVPNRIGR